MKEGHIGRGSRSPYFGSSTECSWQFLFFFLLVGGQSLHNIVVGFVIH